MTITRFNPRFPSLWREFDELFKDFTPVADTNGRERAMIPAADVLETEKAVEIRLDMPGVKPEEIEVKLEENVLTISAERKSEKTAEDKGWIRQERAYGRFSRSFTIPATLDASKPEATYRNGVLTVTVPKREELQPKTLKVKVEA